MRPVGSQYRSAAESLSFSLRPFDQSTANGRPNPDEESVSYSAVTPCRMLLAMWHLLRFAPRLHLKNVVGPGKVSQIAFRIRSSKVRQEWETAIRRISTEVRERTARPPNAPRFQGVATATRQVQNVLKRSRARNPRSGSLLWSGPGRKALDQRRQHDQIAHHHPTESDHQDDPQTRHSAV